jgi:hypothetical protein
LEPGELYDLQLDPQMPKELQQQQQQQQQQQPPALLSPPQPKQQKQKKQKKRRQGAVADGVSIQVVQDGAAPLDGQKQSKAKKRKQRSLQQGALQLQQQPELADVQPTGPLPADAAEVEQSLRPGKGARSCTKHGQLQPTTLGTRKRVEKHKAVRPRKQL